jgi:hypothetical protein
LLARAAQNGVSMFVSVYRAATARERSFRDVPPETVYAPDRWHESAPGSKLVLYMGNA